MNFLIFKKALQKWTCTSYLPWKLTQISDVFILAIIKSARDGTGDLILILNSDRKVHTCLMNKKGKMSQSIVLGRLPFNHMYSKGVGQREPIMVFK